MRFSWTKYLVLCAVASMLLGVAELEANLLFDPFDNNDLATATGDAINGGFSQVTNGIGSNGVTEEINNNEARIATSTDSGAAGNHPIWGIISKDPLDAINNAIEGLTITWVVLAADVPYDDGIQLTAQSSNGFVDDPSGAGRASLALKIKSTPNPFEVELLAQDSAGITNSYSTRPYEIAELGDGFTAILEVTSGGWSYTVTGLLATGDSITSSGNWVTGFEFSDLLDGSVFVGAYMQGKDDDVGSRELHIDSISVSQGTSDSEWAASGNLVVARLGHTATQLPDGRVLVVGGEGFGDDGFGTAIVPAVELWEPTTGEWQRGADLPGTPPDNVLGRHTATLLHDGRVLVVGGVDDSNWTTTATSLLYDPIKDTWTATGSLATARNRHTATLLPDGRVLVSGGCNGDYDASPSSLDYGRDWCFPALMSAEIWEWDPVGEAGSWSTAGNMTALRQLHTATLLTSGKVLVAGGCADIIDAGSFPCGQQSAEVYDPGSNLWAPSFGPMTIARAAHTATLLATGEVLVVGETSAELFDPAGETFSATTGLPPMPTTTDDHYYHTASLLPSGEVLVSGGCKHQDLPCHCDYRLECLSSSLLYDRASESWDTTAVGDLLAPRPRATSNVMPGARILMIGDVEGEGSNTEVLAAADAGMETTGDLNLPREDHVAVLLITSEVLAVGGGDNSAEIFDPNLGGGTWNLTTNMNQADARSKPAAVLLQGGDVLVVGGTVAATQAERFSPGGAWIQVGGSFGEGSTATMLPSGKVLCLDGYNAFTFDSTDNSWTSVATLSRPRGPGFVSVYLPMLGKILVVGGDSLCPTCTELFDPNTGISTEVDHTRDDRRDGFTATLLPSGKVLVAGGWLGTSSAHSSAELYDPESNQWTLTGSMVENHKYHKATILPSGKVLVSGGWRGDVRTEGQEMYDPATGTWKRVTDVNEDSLAGHTATLLQDGRVLIAGGSSELAGPLVTSTLWSAESGAARRPSITAVSSPFGHENTPVLVTGFGFGGDSETASGSRSSSSANYPRLSLINLHSGWMAWIGPDILPIFCPDEPNSPFGFCSNQEKILEVSRLPSTLDPGHYLLTAFASGVASEAVYAEITCGLVVSGPADPGPIAVGNQATLSITSEGGRFFEWQSCVSGATACDAGIGWNPLSGANSVSYTTDPIAGSDTGTQYRCVVDSGCKSETSSVVTLQVDESNAPTVTIIEPNGGEYWTLSPGAPDPDNNEIFTWTMSDDVRICLAELDLLCSTDSGGSYQSTTSDVGLVSYGDGGVCVEAGAATTTTFTYTMPESPPCALGSLYKAEVIVTDHAGNATTVTSASPFYMVEQNNDNIDTLILHDVNRMQVLDSLSQTQVDDLTLKLYELADNNQVNGQVVDLGAVSSLQTLLATWDASSFDPDVANQVLFDTGGLHDYLVNTLLATFNNVSYVVLVGDDRVIPLARMLDGGALLLESSYPTNSAPYDLTTTGTSVGQALTAGYYLSDDPLAVEDDVTATELTSSTNLIFTPDRAFGRLVETPEEIINTIATFISTGGGLDLTAMASTEHQVQVTGYDFIIDAANTNLTRWRNLLGGSDPAPVDGELIGTDWGLSDATARATALAQHLRGDHDDPPGGAYQILNLNGHASHYEEGVPGTGAFDIQGLDTSEIDADFTGSVIFGVGCHAGLSVAGTTDPDDNPSDLPQTYLAQGAMGYVANTGYGWGLLSGIGYSERMVQILTEELTTAGSVAFGEAVRSTKTRYVLEATTFDAYDTKTLHQWVLYGLPMYGITTSSARSGDRLFDGPAPFIDELNPEIKLGPVVAEQTATGAGAADRGSLPDYLTQLSLSFNLSAAGVYTKYKSDGTIEAASGCSDASGCYYTLNGLVERASSSTDLPLQPYLIFDSRLSGTSQHGVLWLGGTYQEETGWVPLYAELISNAGGGDDHGAAPKKIGTPPTGISDFTGAEPADCSTVDYETNSLTVVTGMAVDTAGDGSYSTERIFDTVDVEGFYFNNTADNTGNCDYDGPVIDTGPFSGSYHQLVDTTLSWQVPVSDADGSVWRVVVVYDDESQNAWLPLELTEDAGDWIGSLDIAVISGLTYVIQAVDTRGNVTALEYQTADTPSSGVDIAVFAAEEIDICSEISFPTTVSNATGLRWAMDCAAQSGGAATITISTDISLTDVDNTTDGNNGLPNVSSELTIEGADFTIERSDSAADTFRLFHVAATGDLTLRELTLLNGSAQDTDAGTRDDEGGAIFNEGIVTLDRCEVAGNQSADEGGAVRNEPGAQLILVNSILAGNLGSDAAVRNDGTTTITNSTLSGNSPAGIMCPGTLTIDNGLLWGNSSTDISGAGTITVNYTGVEGGWAGTGNVILSAGDGIFVSPLSSSLAPTTSGDYHLLSDAANPAIDAGDNTTASGLTTDIDGDPRIHNGIVDLGADELTASPLPALGFFSATASNGQNKLEWLNPSEAGFAATRIMVRTDTFPIDENDGTLVVEDGTAGAGNYDSFTHSGLSNEQTYYYAAFILSDLNAYSSDKTVQSTPFDNSGSLKWRYSTDAAALAPPGLSPGAIGAGAIYAVANDHVLHAMNPTASGGDWPQSGSYSWSPLTMNAPAQHRPVVVPLAAGSRIFLASQDGFAYCIDSETGAQIWQSTALSTMLQANPAGLFSDFVAGAPNALWVGSRDAGGANALYALDPETGATESALSFDNRVDQGGDGTAIGIITGAAADYTFNRVYFTSRSSENNNDTVWCINVGGASASLLWSRAIGDIDGAPTLYAGKVIIGTNSGEIHVLDSDTGADLWSAPYDTGDGPVKGYVIPHFGSDVFYFSTTNLVWALRDDGTSATKLWDVNTIPSPSVPLWLVNSDDLLVGGGDGALYQISVSAGSVGVSVSLSAAPLGSPTLDVVNSMGVVGASNGEISAFTLPLVARKAASGDLENTLPGKGPSTANTGAVAPNTGKTAGKILGTCAAMTAFADTAIFFDDFESGDLSWWNSPIPRFSATRFFDLELEVLFKEALSGEHTLHLKLLSPGGFHYQTFDLPISSNPASAGELRAVEGYPRPLPIRVITPSGRDPCSLAVGASLPVAGTLIVSSSIYGQWTVEASLDDVSVPCATADFMIVQ